MKRSWKQDYQSGVGMLLYLVKQLCPNLAQVTRGLSKVDDDVNPAIYEELIHMIKYAIDTKNLGLKIKPMRNTNKHWEIICFSNIDYAGDLTSRQNINGFILYVLGVRVSR